MTEAVLSELAEADLTDIWIFVAQDDEKAADHLLDEIHDKCSFWLPSPRRAARDSNWHLRSESFAVGSYIIFYRERNDGIEVARVLHGRRDLPPLF
jgi:toxin ParE1/3/4